MSHITRHALRHSAAVCALLVAGTSGAMAAKVIGGGSTLAAPTYKKQFQDAPQSGVTFSYYTSGSGLAQSAFLNNNAAIFGGGAAPGTPVDFGASDATLSSTQINTFQSTYSYPLIQIPTFGTPITLAFDLSADKTDGSLALTDAQVCGIFSGKITSWSSIAGSGSTATISVGYRADGSGTSFLFTQHLAAVCNSTNSNFFNTGYLWATNTPAGTTSFASLFPSSTPPSNFTGSTGSSGVQSFVLNTSNSLAYLSPDYTDIAGANKGLGYPPVASVNSVLPTVANTSSALGTAPLPTNPANQMQWVPAVPNPKQGYPIVGYTTWELSSCYTATSGVAPALITFLQSLYNVGGTTTGTKLVNDTTNNGFVPVTGVTNSAPVASGTLAALINSTFLSGTGSLKINNSACPATAR